MAGCSGTGSTMFRTCKKTVIFPMTLHGVPKIGDPFLDVFQRKPKRNHRTSESNCAKHSQMTARAPKMR